MTMQAAARVMEADMSHSEWSADDTPDAIRARRNVLFGYWAGERMGLSGEALSRYARQMHLADYVVKGDQDLIVKIQQDFEAMNLTISQADALRLLRSLHQQALRESGCTD
ncbi:ATPase inhibitor subunit zeta [Allorhizobium undicola]|uniref:ATPase inhibitor subunit zeta n=1 Tax=Allorhizobium undicola TaxID=78527 RepID=UPI000688975B|nr:ATPase inhibitor subunit zeta [Allorhizobium undicola]